MSPDRWLAYSGPLCDDPAELRGLPYEEAEVDVPDAADLAGLGDWVFTRDGRA